MKKEKAAIYIRHTIMDQDTCKIIYLDRRAPKAGSTSTSTPEKTNSDCASSGVDATEADLDEVRQNLESLASVFQKGAFIQ